MTVVEIVLAYTAVGMALLALTLCLPRYFFPVFGGWVHAILTCVVFVVMWPPIVIHGFFAAWRIKKKAP